MDLEAILALSDSDDSSGETDGLTLEQILNEDSDQETEEASAKKDFLFESQGFRQQFEGTLSENDRNAIDFADNVAFWANVDASESTDDLIEKILADTDDNRFVCNTYT